MAQEPRWTYRFESRDPKFGLWYNDSQEWVFESGISKVETSTTKSLPMGYDERYKKDNKNWHSSAPTKELMRGWFSEEDVVVLVKNGFVLYAYLATEYVDYEHETCFVKETCIKRMELDPREFYKQ